ncbi:MAG TPA: transglycosylase domain-containing protein, partial [Chthoniobacterales bacterium]
MARPKKRRSTPPRPTAPPPKPPPRKRSLLWRFVEWGFKLALALAVVWGLIGGFYYLLSLRYNLREMGTMPQRSAVFDRNGEFYSRLSGENRVVVPFDQVSNHFINALICREDARFYQHVGVDPIGIARAVVRNLLMGGVRQGASTITQQL